MRVPDLPTFVGVYSGILHAKCKALRAKAAIEKPNTIPADRFKRIIDGLAWLLFVYVPQERQADVMRELRLLEVRDEANQRKATRAKK